MMNRKFNDISRDLMICNDICHLDVSRFRVKMFALKTFLISQKMSAHVSPPILSRFWRTWKWVRQVECETSNGLSHAFFMTH